MGETPSGIDGADTDNVYTPTEDGMHIVRVIDAVCGTIETQLDIVVGAPCSLDYDLVKNDHELAVENIANRTGLTTFQWELDAGGGYQVLGATSQIIEIATLGLYRVTVDGDDPVCSIEKAILVLDNCALFKGYIAKIEAGVPDGVTFTGAVMNAPAGTSVNCAWYEWIAENWQLIGTGQTLNLPDANDPANIRLMVSVGTCVQEDFTHDQIDPTDFFVDVFTCKQPVDQGGTLTENQIGSKYTFRKNGVDLKYIPLASIAASTQQNVCSYDHATNTLKLSGVLPASTGDGIEVKQNH